MIVSRWSADGVPRAEGRPERRRGRPAAHRGAELVLDDLRVRLYLSSFSVGSHRHRLLQLLGVGRRTALIPNALDG